MLNFGTNLNGRLIIVITAVTLSFSFLSDPSISLRLRDLTELEKPFINGGYSGNDQVDQVMKEIFLRKSETDGWHTVGYYIGLFCGWPVADRYGRKRGILYSNLFRFIGVFLHFLAIIVSTCNPSLGGVLPVHSGPEDHARTSSPPNATSHTSSNQTSPTPFHSETSIFVYISLYGRFADGLYSGLTTVMGILYVYEISPKSSSEVGCLSIMALYLFLKTTAEYVISVAIPPLQYTPQVNYSTWCVTGYLSVIAGLIQVILLGKYCPESPCYNVLQRRKPEEARAALVHLRGAPSDMEQDVEQTITEEMDEIIKNHSVRDFLKRSMFLVSLYFVFTLYHGFFLFMGFAHGLEVGINLVLSVNCYLILTTAALLVPLFSFNNLPLAKIKMLLFSYYLLLGVLYFILTILMTINFYIAPSLFQSNQLVATLIFLVTGIAAAAFAAGPGILTTVLVMEYANQEGRAKNLVLSWISGVIVTSKAVAFFALIFIKAIFLYYVIFQTFPWLFLGCVTWFVWKFETVGYGARNREGVVDSNANFQMTDRNANKQTETTAPPGATAQTPENNNA